MAGMDRAVYGGSCKRPAQLAGRPIGLGEEPAGGLVVTSRSACCASLGEPARLLTLARSRPEPVLCHVAAPRGRSVQNRRARARLTENS